MISVILIKFSIFYIDLSICNLPAIHLRFTCDLPAIKTLNIVHTKNPARVFVFVVLFLLINFVLNFLPTIT